MKLFSRRDSLPHGAFSFGRGAVVYVFVLIFAVIFTQALRSSVSVVFLWITVTAPVILFLYALIGRANIGAFVLSDETTAEKLTPVEYEFRISNYTILPMPFVEAEVFLPSRDGVMCESRLVRMSVLPHGEYRFKSEITFRYRGSYRVGVGCIYVSDFFRIFRLRRYVNVYNRIYVMPRRLLFSRAGDRSPSDMPSDSRAADGNESNETNLIREYRNGDPLKHVHWKLSSKMQDLQVNDYKPNSSKNVFIFCDFMPFLDESTDKRRRAGRKKPKNSQKAKKERIVRVKLPRRAVGEGMTVDEKREAREEAASDKAAAALAVSKLRSGLFPDADDKKPAEDDIESGADAEGAESAVSGTIEREDKYEHANDILPEYVRDFNLYCADGVSELAIGEAESEIERGNTVTFMWFDRRSDSGYFCRTAHTYADIDSFFKTFGTAPFCPEDMRVSLLPTLLDDTDSPVFVFVTAKAGLDALGEYISASRGADAVRTEILLFDPKERFGDRKLHREYMEFCRERYAENNIKLTAVDPSWAAEK